MEQSLFLENDNPVEFLYLDKLRIASLIGQLSDTGMLTGYKSVISKTGSKEGSGNINARIASFGAKLGKTSLESSEQTYDPFWTHAYSFLQDLEKNFSVPLENARVGSLVSFTAFVQFVDLRMMRN